jgi:hypothetical protein
MTRPVFSPRWLSHLATRTRWLLMVSLPLLVLSSDDALAAGGKPAKKLVNVADTRGVEGLSRWIADVYNTSYWLYGLLVVAVMVFMGLTLGLLCDRAMGTLGIDLGKMQHHE